LSADAMPLPTSSSFMFERSLKRVRETTFSILERRQRGEVRECREVERCRGER